MRLALINGRVLRADTFVRGQCVLIEHGRILDVLPADDARCRSAEPYDLGGGLLLPGFIDLQVNGGGGVLFNDAPSVESIRAIGAAHRRFGTTAFLPTLISADLDIVARAIAAVRGAIAAGVPGVLGIHVEGPFLNAARTCAYVALVWPAETVTPAATSWLMILGVVISGASVTSVRPLRREVRSPSALGSSSRSLAGSCTPLRAALRNGPST